MLQRGKCTSATADEGTAVNYLSEILPGGERYAGLVVGGVEQRFADLEVQSARKSCGGRTDPCC